MLQQTWSIICQRVDTENEQAIQWQVFVANQNPTEEGFFLLDCQSVFQSQPKTTGLEVGTLVVLMPLSQKSPKAFGIVENVNWDPISCVNKDEQFLATFQLRVKNSLNPHLLNTAHPVLKITSLCPIINQLFMITELDNSPLKKIIIQPSKQEKAFQLALSYSEQLGNVSSHSNHQHSAVQSICRTILISDPTEPKVALLEGPPGLSFISFLKFRFLYCITYFLNFETGTGKTNLILEMVVEFVFQHHRRFGTNPRILVCAPSDSAVDEIVARLLLKYPQSQDNVKSNFTGMSALLYSLF